MLYKTYKETAGRGKIAARVATVRAALSAVITYDVDQADRLDVLEGAYRVLVCTTDRLERAVPRQSAAHERRVPLDNRGPDKC